MKKLTLLAALIPVIVFAQTDSTQPDPVFVTVPTAGDCAYPQMAWDRSNITGLADGDDTADTHEKKFVQFRSINLWGGGDFYRDGFEDRSIFQQAAPNSTIAFADVSGYTNWDNSFAYYGTNANSSMGVNLNLHLRCQKKFGELRVGFSHSSVSISSQYFSRNYRETMDTTALPGGQIMYTDSVSTSGYSLNWNSELIQLHIGWVVRSDPRRWLSFYTGIGFCGGFGYNGVIDMYHSHDSYLHHYTPQSGMSYNTNQEHIVEVQERYKAPGFTTFAVYMPVGMNIRLGTRNSVFRHLTLFSEYNGAIMFITPQGVNTKIRTISSTQGGVRWYFHAPGKPNGKARKHARNRRDGATEEIK